MKLVQGLLRLLMMLPMPLLRLELLQRLAMMLLRLLSGSMDKNTKSYPPAAGYGIALSYRI